MSGIDFLQEKRKKKKANYKFIIVVEGDAEEQWINIIKHKYNRDVEIILKGKTSVRKVENMLDIYEENIVYEPDFDLKIYIVDLDVCITNSANINNFREYIDNGIKIYYSKPSFEYFLLLYAIYFKFINIKSFEKITKSDIEKILRNNTFPDLMNGKSITKSFIEKIEVNSFEEFIEFANDILEQENVNFKVMRKENIDKIINHKYNITNVHCLVDKIINKI